MKLACLAAALSLAVAAPASDPSDALGPTLAQVRTFSISEGEMVWPGYGSAPFGFLMVAGQQETLLCQSGKPAGFKAEPREPATGCERWSRPRSGLPDNLLAAMPLVGPESTIVMGAPATTGRSRGDWVRTILHEHLHQWQAALPGYYPRTSALGLAETQGDGMWMLNFPFPYADPKPGEAYARASVALADAVAARKSPAFEAAFDRYLAARAAFAATVPKRAWRYLEFELWQEGVARWTEVRLGRIYPDAEVRSEAEALEQRALARLRAPDLKAQGRELAYPVGEGEALLLEACGSRWRADYPKTLALGPLLRAARDRCSPK